jgi:hypothetical protein
VLILHRDDAVIALGLRGARACGTRRRSCFGTVVNTRPASFTPVLRAQQQSPPASPMEIARRLRLAMTDGWIGAQNRRSRQPYPL